MAVLLRPAVRHPNTKAPIHLAPLGGLMRRRTQKARPQPCDQRAPSIAARPQVRGPMRHKALNPIIGGPRRGGRVVPARSENAENAVEAARRP
jgi:hypothetical protein